MCSTVSSLGVCSERKRQQNCHFLGAKTSFWFTNPDLKGLNALFTSFLTYFLCNFSNFKTKPVARGWVVGLDWNRWGGFKMLQSSCNRSREKIMAKIRKQVLQSSPFNAHQVYEPKLQLLGFACHHRTRTAAAVQLLSSVCHLVLMGIAPERCKKMHPKAAQPSSHRKTMLKGLCFSQFCCYLVTPHTSPPWISRASVTWWALNIFHASQCRIKLYY